MWKKKALCFSTSKGTFSCSMNKGPEFILHWAQHSGPTEVMQEAAFPGEASALRSTLPEQDILRERRARHRARRGACEPPARLPRLQSLTARPTHPAHQDAMTLE